MPTLVATAGATNANSYATTSDGDTYFDERLNSTAWTGAATDDKERALIMATRRLDQETYTGEKTATAQALEWPRESVVDKDGEEYSSSTIPTFLKHATYELALRLLNDGTTDPFSDTGMEEFKRAKVGELEVERFAGFTAGQLPANVRGFIEHVLEGGSRYSGRLMHTGNG